MNISGNIKLPILLLLLANLVSLASALDWVDDHAFGYTSYNNEYSPVPVVEEFKNDPSDGSLKIVATTHRWADAYWHNIAWARKTVNRDEWPVELSVRIASFDYSGTDPDAAAGVAFRKGSSGNAPSYGVRLTSDGYIQMRKRTEGDPSIYVEDGSGSPIVFSGPVYLKLRYEKRPATESDPYGSDWFIGYYSTDGVNYTQIAEIRQWGGGFWQSNGDFQMGVAASSNYMDQGPVTVVFDNFEWSGGGLEGPDIPSNAPPPSDSIVVNIDEDGPNPQGGDAHSDTDIDGDPLSSTVDTVVGVYGTFTIAADGTYSYTLDNSNSIIDGLGEGESPDPIEQSFTITVTDSVNDPINRDVTVNISGSNDRPVLIGDANPSLPSATEGDTSYASHNFGGSFTDPEDGVNLTYNITGKPSWLDFTSAGVLSLASGQSVGSAGSYPMTVSVSDSGDPALAPVGSISFTLTVDAAPPPPPPPPSGDEVPESADHINQQIIFFGASVGASQTDGARIDASGTDLEIVNVDHNSNIKLTNNGNDALVIDSNGVVTVGATASDFELEVTGLIRAEGVVVEAHGGADFVFEEGYDLPTLQEVEQHIDAKGHLPGVPSAEEMEDGISIGESHKILLQKVEELTLYLIEKDKQIEELKREIEQLKSKGEAN